MKHKNNGSAQYRQGDVMIERIAALPSGLKPASLEQGKVILAHGEVTGHHHAFAGTEAEKFTGEGGREFFRVKGRALKFTLPILRRWKGQVMVDHPKHGVIEFSVADVEIKGNEVTVAGDFGLLKHDEHKAHGIPAGIYKGANGSNGTVRQREYSPEAIRNVAD